jgi:hypothetical protein
VGDVGGARVTSPTNDELRAFLEGHAKVEAATDTWSKNLANAEFIQDFREIGPAAAQELLEARETIQDLRFALEEMCNERRWEALSEQEKEEAIRKARSG